MALTAEHVVLLDRLGLPAGTVAKREVHTPRTPLHLAFSCYVVDRRGRVLLTRRASSKTTWPGVWTNACCGHPQDGESLRAAVTRRLGEELGLRPTRMAVLLPDFAYRAQMTDGTVEHELCPVLVAEVDDAPVPAEDEVDDVAWVAWPELHERARRDPGSLSPWSVEQVHALAALGWHPADWPAPDRLLDTVPVTAPTPPVATDGDPLGPVGGPLREVLDAFLDEKAAELIGIDPALAPVVQEVRALVGAGGKRLRPAFVHWGNRAVTEQAATPGLAHVGAAIELLHTFALLHDDVMDRADRRRGRPAAHVSFRAQHEAAGLLGDAGWFGVSAAVLAGDLAFVWADELLDRSGLPPVALERVRRIFSTLRSEVMAGQYLDLLHGADPGADEPGARRVALLKSARYTVTRPLQLGAAAADAGDDHRVRGALADYGDAVGTAFQLRDDVLGLFGDPTETGKSTVDDLREGKRTLLVLRARRLGDERQRRILDDALGDPTVDDERADAVRAVVADTGALASIELLISHQHALALRAIEPVPEPARGALGALASRATRRVR